MNEFAHPASAPQVRTLLLTDLCDSTLLVERLGDGPAAELFRAHDRLVLELQQRWHGRLIDRSDGLLLLFERPIDGLGFALDYARGLRELGERPEVKQRKLELRARAGLHVGEVLTWHNSEAAVQAGAKPLEVEGIAKPLAGRLMTLARPGQILLSATAEPLARRASRELGERADTLIWKSHGRWRFKGMPDGQEIFEVGEPGHAPLRAPKQNGGKAWRDIPLWRRPAALAAEVLLVVGMGTGLWFITRPTPAIAFSERDWVVVGDLRNLTGDAVLDESLEQAFRISLEQSRHVNVLSDLKVRDTLALMKRDADTTLDRAVASEIAIRDGARAVILPTVAEVGGRVRVSAEVIDPHTQTTVYAESADGRGAGSTLSSIDQVTGELRERLGEAISSIERDSAPLPKVSTSDLDALKAYALGNRHRAKGNDKRAVAFFQRALELDDKFALARLALAKMQGKLGNTPEARRQMDRASADRDHLSAREKLMLDAALAEFGPVDIQLQRLQQLVEMYPDTLSAQFSLAQQGMFYANRYAEGLPHARAAAVPQFERHRYADYLQGMLLLGMERYREADRMFRHAGVQGFTTPVFAYMYPAAAQRRWAEVDRMFGARRGTGVRTAEVGVPYHRMLFAIDRGQWQDAQVAGLQAYADAKAAEPLIAARAAHAQLLALQAWRETDPPQQLQRRLLAQLDDVGHARTQLEQVYEVADDAFVLFLGYAGARADLLPVVERALGDVHAVEAYPMLAEMREVLLAERDRLRGRPALSVERLRPLARSIQAGVPVHATLLRAARAAGAADVAMEQARWLTQHRGRAYVETGVEDLPTPLNVADTTLAQLDVAELEAPRDAAASAAALKIFLATWPRAQLPPTIGRRVDALETSLAGQADPRLGMR